MNHHRRPRLDASNRARILRRASRLARRPARARPRCVRPIAIPSVFHPRPARFASSRARVASASSTTARSRAPPTFARVVARPASRHRVAARRRHRIESNRSRSFVPSSRVEARRRASSRGRRRSFARSFDRAPVIARVVVVARIVVAVEMCGVDDARRRAISDRARARAS